MKVVAHHAAEGAEHYAAAGRRTLKLLANDTSATFIHDAAGRTLRVANLGPSDPISIFDYQYDDAGRRVGMIESSGDRTSWTYDDSGQLLTEYRTGAAAWRHTFVYDESGNRLTKTVETGEITTSAYDQANRHLFAEDDSGRTTFGYDLDGNQSLVEEPAGDLTTRVWDFDNRLLRVELPSADIHNFVHAIVRRDGTIQRVSTDDGTDFVRQVWDEDRVIAERDDLGFTTAEYTLEPAGYGNLVSQHRDDETSIHHFDALGSTRELTDDTSAVTDEYQHEAFGEPQAALGTTQNPYQWAGEQGYRREQQLGQQKLRQRIYDPKYGRFHTEDPIRDDRVNPYRYANNAPIHMADPSGLTSTVLAVTAADRMWNFPQRQIWLAPDRSGSNSGPLLGTVRDYSYDDPGGNLIKRRVTTQHHGNRDIFSYQRTIEKAIEFGRLSYLSNADQVDDWWLEGTLFTRWKESRWNRFWCAAERRGHPPDAGSVRHEV